MAIFPLFILLLFGLGFCLSTIISPGTPRATRLIIAFPLGAGIFTLLIFCTTQLSELLINQTLLLALLLADFFFLALVIHMRGGYAPAIAHTARASLTTWARAELILIFLIFAPLAIVGIIVPVENWDVYLEYLPFARELFSTGRISPEASPIAALVLPALPLNHVLLMASGYILYGDVIHPWARGLSPLYAALIITLLYQIGRRYLALSTETILGGVLLCLALPTFSEYATVPSSSLAFCFHAIAMLYFVMEYFETRQGGASAMAGMFLGMAYWTSYAGAVLIACTFTIFAIFRLTGSGSTNEEIRGLRIPFKQLAIIFSIASVIIAPHIIRNYLLFGNPVYPALYNIFGGIWINDWSIANLVHIIVPQHSYLRLRWEVFHEGFFIQLLFYLALLSSTWYRSKNAFILACFCIFYQVFYLLFLTWPRSSGVSLKLLLPSFVPACLLAGGTLNRIIKKTIPLWQSLVIFSLIPIWSMIMLRDDPYWTNVGNGPYPSTLTSTVTALWALLNDADEILIWFGVILCLLAQHASPKNLIGRAAPAFLLLAIACRPLADNAHFLTNHLGSCIQDPSYSFWNASSTPSYFPEAAWMNQNLPKDAVIGTFDNRTYLYPRKVIPLDSPKFWPIYQGADIQQAITLLLHNGVTHLCLSDYTTKTHPLYGMSPLFDYLGNPHYIPLLYSGPLHKEPGHETKVYEIMANGCCHSPQ